MAKLIIKEVYEGSNDEIQELKEYLDHIVESKVGGKVFGDLFVSVESKVELDKVEEVKDTPLQVHLKRELNLYRSILNADAIAQAEKLIEEAATSKLTAEEVADLEKQSSVILDALENNGDDHWDYYDEEYDDEDDCDCDDDYIYDEEDEDDDSVLSQQDVEDFLN
jgi:hypothetical protein